MNCNHCDSKMKDGIMLCTTNDWRINDSSGNLKAIIEIHGIESGDDEIGDTYPIEYCDCGKNPNIISYIELAYTESQLISLWFPDDNTKTITDVINDVKTEQSFNDIDAKDFIKEHFSLVTDWSV